MDEFDRYGVRTMATLKNLMQLKKLKWFTSEEEQAIQENNRLFYRQSPNQDICSEKIDFFLYKNCLRCLFYKVF